VAAPRLDQPQLAVFRTPDRLVILRSNGGDVRVVVARSIGGGPRALTFHGAAAWSPEGKRLAFTGDFGSPRTLPSRHDIFVVRADGSEPRRLTTSGDTSDPVWSPDGERIYFTRHPNSHPEQIDLSNGLTVTPAWIWSMRPDGSDQREVTAPVAGRVERPGSFSPDGAWLAFTRGRDTDLDPARLHSSQAVWVMRPDGSAAHKLAERAQDPAFSPDGRRIAFSSDRDQNGRLNYGDRAFFANDLYVMNSDGSRPQRLTRTLALNEQLPSWMPSGAQIAYQRGKQYQNSETMKVLRANPDGSCARTVAASPGPDAWPWHTAPAWRPGDARRGDGRLRCNADRPDVGRE
jgi:Tol biopolymer transport system component